MNHFRSALFQKIVLKNFLLSAIGVTISLHVTNTIRRWKSTTCHITFKASRHARNLACTRCQAGMKHIKQPLGRHLANEYTQKAVLIDAHCLQKGFLRKLILWHKSNLFAKLTSEPLFHLKTSNFSYYHLAFTLASYKENVSWLSMNLQRAIQYRKSNNAAESKI